MRFFNTAGPVNRDDHYCIDPLKRFDLEEILFLIGQKKYFILHAPRQTGKASFTLALMEHLNQQGRYACVYCNIEAAQAARENLAREAVPRGADRSGGIICCDRKVRKGVRK